MHRVHLMRRCGRAPSTSAAGSPNSCCRGMLLHPAVRIDRPGAALVRRRHHAARRSAFVLPEQTRRRLLLNCRPRCGAALDRPRRLNPATSHPLPTPQHSAPSGTTDVQRLALEVLGQWIQDHGQHFDRHTARTESAPRYGPYEHGELVAVSLRPCPPGSSHGLCRAVIRRRCGTRGGLGAGCAVTRVD